MNPKGKQLFCVELIEYFVNRPLTVSIPVKNASCTTEGQYRKWQIAVLEEIATTKGR